MKKVLRNIKFKIAKIFFKEKHKKMIIENFYKGIDNITTTIIENWKSIFLGFVLFFEFVRKISLYNLGVPIFVLNSDSILNIASYGITISIIFFLFIIFWVFSKFFAFTITKEGLFFSILEKLGFVVFSLTLILIIIVFSNKPIGINQDDKLIYINDIYQVEKDGTNIKVYDKKSKLFYHCSNANSYNDNCKILK